jgi:hypothetical protein
MNHILAVGLRSEWKNRGQIMNSFCERAIFLSDLDLDESKNAGEAIRGFCHQAILGRKIRWREVYEVFRTNLASERSEHTPAPHGLSTSKKVTAISAHQASGLSLRSRRSQMD